MAETPHSNLVTLDESGDLLLDVRDSASSRSRRFLVSSDAISLASPRFIEQQYAVTESDDGVESGPERNQDSERPVALLLWTDNLEAMDTILSAVHFKPKRVNACTAKEIAMIAVESESFGFTAALAPWIGMWCDHSRLPLSATTKLTDMGYGILAAYLFRARKLGELSGYFVRFMPPDFAKTWEADELLRKHLPKRVWGQ